MSIDQSVSDFLNGGGAKSAKFDQPGDTIVGTVSAAKVAAQTEIGTNTPKTWPNGDVMEQLIVTLADTSQKDPADSDDDGSRNLYVKGSKKNPLSLAGALIVGLRNAGATGLDVGGKLAVRFTGYGTPTQPGLSAPKQYVVQYQAPALVAGADLFGPEGEAAPAAQPAPVAPAPQAQTVQAPVQPAVQPPAAPGGDLFANVHS